MAVLAMTGSVIPLLGSCIVVQTCIKDAERLEVDVEAGRVVLRLSGGIVRSQSVS